jgi:hypothetical protein
VAVRRGCDLVSFGREPVMVWTPGQTGQCFGRIEGAVLNGRGVRCR